MSFSFVTDNAALNQALFQVTHGLYVVTAKREGKLNGQVLDALMQVTNAPPRIAVGMGKRSLTHEMIAETGHFVVSVLDRNDPACAEVIRRFGFQSGRDVDKFAGFPYETLGARDSLLAHGSCGVRGHDSAALDGRSHHALALRRVGRSGGHPRWRRAADVQRVSKEHPKGDAMKKWVCTVCGYVYDPAEGDPTAGVISGNAF